MENIIEDPIVYSSRSKKEMMVKLYANDKQSLFKFISFYNNLNKFNLFKYSRIYLCHKENGQWIANVNKHYNINNYQPNYRFLYSSLNNFYTFKQLVEMLESNDYIILLSKNSKYYKD